MRQDHGNELSERRCVSRANGRQSGRVRARSRRRLVRVMALCAGLHSLRLF